MNRLLFAAALLAAACTPDQATPPFADVRPDSSYIEVPLATPNGGPSFSAGAKDSTTSSSLIPSFSGFRLYQKALPNDVTRYIYKVYLTKPLRALDTIVTIYSRQPNHEAMETWAQRTHIAAGSQTVFSDTVAIANIPDTTAYFACSHIGVFAAKCKTWTQIRPVPVVIDTTPPPPPPVTDTTPVSLRPDSVKLTQPLHPSWDTADTLVSFNYSIWPHPIGALWNIRFLVNGTLVKTCRSCGVTSTGASTAQVSKKGYTTMNIVACAIRTTDTVGPERCSAAVTWTAPVSAMPIDSSPGFYQLAIGPAPNEYRWNGSQWAPGTDSLKMPIWTRAYPAASADTGRHLYLTTNAGATWKEIPAIDSQTIMIARTTPGTILQMGLRAYLWDGVAKTYQRTDMVKDSTGGRWCADTMPAAPLPQPTPSPDGTRRIVRIIVSPACTAFRKN